MDHILWDLNQHQNTPKHVFRQPGVSELWTEQWMITRNYIVNYVRCDHDSKVMLLQPQCPASCSKLIPQPSPPPLPASCKTPFSSSQLSLPQLQLLWTPCPQLGTFSGAFCMSGSSSFLRPPLRECSHVEVPPPLSSTPQRLSPLSSPVWALHLTPSQPLP